MFPFRDACHRGRRAALAPGTNWTLEGQGAGPSGLGPSLGRGAVAQTVARNQRPRPRPGQPTAAPTGEKPEAWCRAPAPGLATFLPDTKGSAVAPGMLSHRRHLRISCSPRRREAIPRRPRRYPAHNPGPWALGPGVGYLSQSREMTPTVPGEPPAPVQTPSPGSPPPPPLHGGVGGVCCPWIGGMWRLLSSGDSTESCAKPYTAARRAFHGSRSSPTEQVQGVPHFPGHLTRLAAARGCEDFAHEGTRTEARMREDAEDDRVVKPAGNKIIRIKFYGHRRGVKLYRLCSFKQATATTHRPTLGAKAVHAAAPACRARDIAAE